MTQNMFTEGLYQVFFRDRPLLRPETVNPTPEQLKDARITRWFRTIVNTRLLVIGVVQVLSALASVLTTISFICMDFGCSVSMTMPVWCGVFYVATGGLAIHVQRKPNRVKVSMLMGFNIFSLLLGLFSILTYSLHIAKENIPLSTGQRVGAYVAKGGSVFFMVVCLLASVYTLFLTWRGLYHYSAPYRNTYSPLPQGGEEQSDLLLDTENREFSL
ncbi:hypothetical protein ANANG_G00148100 [Anguilla anguilla]|uniref:Uncharacterized protein n=1 Tax=Anguilla anguilla TaxID=7936 RepID=A0A9D3MFG3_ANGAN|nr:hypothetical protein ANANG_G00148100 [Anguilla anguilla]